MIHHDWSIMIHGKIATYPLHPHAFSSLKAIGAGICWHTFGHLPSTCQVTGSYESWETVLSRCDILRYSGYYPWSLRQTHHHGYMSAWPWRYTLMGDGISRYFNTNDPQNQWPWLRRVMVNASIYVICERTSTPLRKNMRKYAEVQLLANIGKCWEWYAGRFQESTCLWVCMIVWYIILFENVRKSVASQFYSILIQLRKKARTTGVHEICGETWTHRWCLLGLIHFSRRRLEWSKIGIASASPVDSLTSSGFLKTPRTQFQQISSTAVHHPVVGEVLWETIPLDRIDTHLSGPRMRRKKWSRSDAVFQGEENMEKGSGI